MIWAIITREWSTFIPVLRDNIDDIEEFIAFIEKKNKKTYLDVIDLPISERPQIMQELSLMGITGGSMFPGLDGACEQLREKNFNI